MSDEVLTQVSGRVLRVTLNRPRALNALTLAMIQQLHAALDAAGTDAIDCVFLEGAGDRGFCAGGDIVMMRASAIAGDVQAETFWRAEYELNARIAECPRPIVAFMDGVVMGGGVGLAAHASHRLATPSLRCAMPEVGIGFTPDVGGSWLLSRAPGECGTHLGLTGTTVGAPDAIFLGLADAVVAAESRESIVEKLADGTEPSAIIETFGMPTHEAALARDQGWIDECYADPDPDPNADQDPDVDAVAIVARLAAHPEPAARQAAALISTKSPTSVAVTLAALRRARNLPTLRACLAQELTVSKAFLAQPDFVEGIRAQVVDKDRNPTWNPAGLEALEPAIIAAFFATI